MNFAILANEDGEIHKIPPISPMRMAKSTLHAAPILSMRMTKWRNPQSTTYFTNEDDKIHSACCTYFANEDGEIHYLTHTYFAVPVGEICTYFAVPLGEICVSPFPSVKCSHKIDLLCKMFQNRL